MRKRDGDRQNTNIREIPEIHLHIPELTTGGSDEVGIIGSSWILDGCDDAAVS